VSDAFWIEDAIKSDFQEPVYIIDRILKQDSGIFLVTGKPGSGKSHFLLQVALDICVGDPILGMFPTMKRKCLYIDVEMGETGLFLRIKAASQRYAGRLPSKSLAFKHLPALVLNTQRGVDTVRELVDWADANVVLLDSISWMINGSDNDDEQMKQTLWALRKIFEGQNLCVIAVHHMRKTQSGFNPKAGKFVDKEMGLEDLRGAGFLAQGVDSVVGIQHISDEAPNKPATKQIAFLKTRYSQPPGSFLCDFWGNSGEFQLSSQIDLKLFDYIRQHKSCTMIELEAYMHLSRHTLIAKISPMITSKMARYEGSTKDRKVVWIQ
jgi:hypothetical protein